MHMAITQEAYAYVNKKNVNPIWNWWMHVAITHEDYPCAIKIKFWEIDLELVNKYGNHS